MRKLLIFIILILFGCQKQKLPYLPNDKESVLLDSSMVKDDDLFKNVESEHGNGSSDPLTSEPPPTTSQNENYKRDTVQIYEKNSVTPSTHKLDVGRILYVVPDTMLVMKDYEIVIRISQSSSSTIIYQNIKQIEKTKTEEIKTTSRMQVELIDPQKDCFNITSINSSKQVVDSTFTEWKFNVQPIKSGTNKLDLVVSVFINGDVKQLSYSDEIYVKTNPKAQIKDFWFTNWKWIFEKLILPVVTWLIGFWMGKKKK